MILRLVLLINLLLTVGVGFTSAQTVSITDLKLRAAIEDALGKAPGAAITTTEMATLTELRAPNADISDLTGLEAAVNVQRLFLGHEYVPAEGRFINSNSISDLTPLVRLTQLAVLDLNRNAISDISALSGLTNLVVLRLGGNVISDISALSGLTNLVVLRLWDNNISDISPLVANRGLGTGEEISVSENPLNDTSINVHIPALQDRGVEVHFSNLKSVLADYLLALPVGLSLIHIPLKVVTVDGVAQPIITIGDLYDALGGSTVNFIITYDPITQEWFAYFGDADKDGPGNRTLTPDMGILVGTLVPVSIRLNGNPLVSDGNYPLTFHAGLNLVGLPLEDARINRVSDLFTLDGLGGNAHAIIVTDGGEFKLAARAGDPGDIPVREGQGFIIIVERTAQVRISDGG